MADSPKILKTGISNDLVDPVISLNGITSTLDMAQSRFFTVEIYKKSLTSDEYMGIDFDNGKRLMPVKNITYTMQGIDIMTLSLGIFKDIPIPVGLRLPKVSLTIVDTDDNKIEKQFREWFGSFNPGDGGQSQYGYVAYLEDMIRYITYRSYRVDGTPDIAFTAPIMLADDYTFTRDYETNDLKTMEANIIIVGEGILNSGSQTI